MRATRDLGNHGPPGAVLTRVGRPSHLAPEEIVGAALLLLLLAFVAVRPLPLKQLFDPPYATPAPGGGPARQLVPDARPAASPATLLFQR